jgi:hypothetical protein
MIDRTTASSYLKVARGYVPTALEPLLGAGERFLPSVFSDGGFDIGPIPAGTPVDLLASLNILSEDPDAAKRAAYEGKGLKLLGQMLGDLKKLPANATDDQARKVLANLVDPLIEMSKCPDMIVNRGHYFGTGFIERGDLHPLNEPGLSDQDKRALIEFLKTF